MALNRMVVPFRHWHYEWLKAPVRVTDGMLTGMERQNSWTAIADGEVIACAGTTQMWLGRHTAWAYMTAATGRHMRWLTRETEIKLAELSGRIEMTVLAHFEAGNRWARMLGFEVETPLMKGYGPDGEDHIGYVRFN